MVVLARALVVATAETAAVAAGICTPSPITDLTAPTRKFQTFSKSDLNTSQIITKAIWDFVWASERDTMHQRQPCVLKKIRDAEIADEHLWRWGWPRGHW